MIPAAIAGIASVASSLIAKSNQPDAPEEADTFGLQSTMQGNQQSQEMADTSVTGSQSDEFFKDMAQDAFKAGSDAVLGHATSSAFSKSASQLGSDQRDYLAAAFPEMNPWERAGASATQQGVQMAETKQKQSMLTQQIEGQKDVARIQGDNAARVAQINQGTSKYGADTSAAASRYGADSSSAASRYGSDTSAQNVDKQINALREKVQADTKLALEKAKTEAEAKSAVGAIAKDAENTGRRILSGTKGIVGQATAMWDDFFKDATKYIEEKFSRDSAAGVQSGYDASKQRKFDDNSNYVKGLK